MNWIGYSRSVVADKRHQRKIEAANTAHDWMMKVDSCAAEFRNNDVNFTRKYLECDERETDADGQVK